MCFLILNCAVYILLEINLKLLIFDITYIIRNLAQFFFRVVLSIYELINSYPLILLEICKCISNMNNVIL